jgi:NAD(P)-dependent dehydrogenase (short-subunit alcohol dehydrogenase family)
MGLLDGRKALITGGASGIGLATAQRFRQEGAKVALLDRDAERGERAAEQLDVGFVEADVRDAGAVEHAVAAAAKQLGGLTTLVNNAGLGNLAPLETHTDELWARIIGVNLTGTFHCMRAALPIIRDSGGGTCVNNASNSGLRPTRGELPYSAAKAGVIALTAGAAQEYAPAIRVNAVAPGLIRTPMTEPLFGVDGALEPVCEATPLARAGSAEEVADVVLFLASDLSRFITGQTLVIDGGMSLPQAGIDETLKNMLALMGYAAK